MRTVALVVGIGLFLALGAPSSAGSARARWRTGRTGIAALARSYSRGGFRGR